MLKQVQHDKRGLKMKTIFRTAKIIALFAAAVAFSSCDNLIDTVVTTGSTTTENETTANGKARLSVSIGEKSARTILPADVTEADITRAELLAKTSEADSFAAVKSWSSDGTASAIAKMSVDTEIMIDAGTYDFTLNLYAAPNGTQTLCQRGTLANVTVAAGANLLAFSARYVADGTGTLALTLTWTANDRIASVQAGLFTAESGGETAVAGYEAADLAIAGDEASGFSATYEKNVVPSGTYFARFLLYAADGTLLNTLEDVTRIETACTTSKTVALSNVNTVYAITYHLTSGEWTDGFTPTESRNANKAVMLPTENDITRTGYDFAGWYTSADGGATLTGDALTAIGAGTAGDTALWAQWTAHEYTITYDLGNNATNASENPATYTIESDTITLAEPTRTGYTFNGWYKGSIADEVNKVTQIAHGSTGDITLTAGWTANIYTITYELDGGVNSAENPETYIIDDTIILAPPTRERQAANGYYPAQDFEFVGWYELVLTSPTTRKQVEVKEISGTRMEDVYLTAKWQSVIHLNTSEISKISTITQNTKIIFEGEADDGTYESGTLYKIGEELRNFYNTNFGSVSVPEYSNRSIEIKLDLSGVTELTHIWTRIFENCDNLTSIILPEGITTIGQEAFSNCDKLESIVLSDSITELEFQAFSYCSKLKSVVLPSNLKKIYQAAFLRCYSLETITIPETLESLGNFVFNDCSSLTDIHYKGTKAEWENITKGYDWHSKVPATVVHCSDGDVAL